MATKYLSNNAGTLTEVIAGTTGGSTDANKIPALDSNGRLTSSMLPSGIGADTASIATSESLTAGDFVNVWNNAGSPAVRKASASGIATRCHGFVLSSFTHPSTATVYFEASNTAVTGQTTGDVYLSATAGQATTTAPTTSGQIVQYLGVATGATSINFEADTPIVLA